MMGNLFESDLDLGVDSSSNDFDDFSSVDLFDFIDDNLCDDLNEIAESDMIPDIESLINFAGDEIQWDDDLSTADFFSEFALPSTESTVTDQQKIVSNANKQNRINKSSKKQRKQNSQNDTIAQNAQLDKSSHEYVLSPSSTAPNSPSTMSCSNDSTDFREIFSNFYSLDSDNNLVSHPISSLSQDEINELNATFDEQSQIEPFSFDLSNNFGGFVNVQSALSLMNRNQLSHDSQNHSSRLTNHSNTPYVFKQAIRRKKSKGTSLLANKPKSYKSFKREMLQKKIVKTDHKLPNNVQQCISEFVPADANLNIVQIDNNLIRSADFIEWTANRVKINMLTSYAQDHDYCLIGLNNS